jgi:hypothetical protein
MFALKYKHIRIALRTKLFFPMNKRDKVFVFSLQDVLASSTIHLTTPPTPLHDAHHGGLLFLGGSLI